MANITEVRDSLTALLTAVEARDVSVAGVIAAQVQAQVEAQTATAKADYEAELQVLKDAMDAETAKVVAGTPAA